MGTAAGSCAVLGEILVFLVSNTAGVSSSLARGVHPLRGVQSSSVLEGGAARGAGPAPCCASTCKPLCNQVELKAPGT